MSEFDVGGGLATIKSKVGTPVWKHYDDDIVNAYDPTITDDAQVPQVVWSDSIYKSHYLPHVETYTYYYVGYPWDTTIGYDGDGFGKTDGEISVAAVLAEPEDDVSTTGKSIKMNPEYPDSIIDVREVDDGTDQFHSAIGGVSGSRISGYTSDRVGRIAPYGPTGIRRVAGASMRVEGCSYMRSMEWGVSKWGTGSPATTEPVHGDPKASWPTFNGVASLWVACIAIHGSSPTVSTPAGWTQQEYFNNSFFALMICTKEADGQSPPAPPSWTTTNADHWTTAMGVIRPYGYGQESTVAVEDLRVMPFAYPQTLGDGYADEVSPTRDTFEDPHTISQYVGASGWDTGDGYSIPYGSDVSTVSLIEDSVQEIDLHHPTLLRAEGMSWTFRLSHDLDGHELRAQKATSRHYDYSVNRENWGDTYRTPAQVARGWYTQKHEVVEHFDVVGGLDFARWRLSLKGLGKAIFTDGDFEALVNVEKDVWYTVDMQVNAEEDEDGNWTVSYVLRQGEDVLASRVATVPSASITNPYIEDTEYYPRRCYFGAEAMMFWSEQLEVEAKDFVLIVQKTDDTIGEVPEYEAGSGWNQEVATVTDGAFSLGATPVRGSVNVYDDEGYLLDYGEDWEEAEGDETGMEYVILKGSFPFVRVVYYVYAPTLEIDDHARRPSQDKEDQARKVVGVTRF
jgi:hypothetical protein